MATTPQFTGTPRVAVIKLATANAALDGTGDMGDTAFAAGANGSRLDKAVIKATTSTSAGMVRLFMTNGAKTTLLSEIEVTAVTRSGSVKAFETVVEFLGGLAIPTGFSIKAATEKGEAINATLFGGDF